MKIKIISVEPDYSSFPRASSSAQFSVDFKPRSVVTYQILGLANAPIEGKVYTTHNEASLVLPEIKKDAMLLVDWYNFTRLVGKELDLTPVSDLKDREIELEGK
jgi:hypothetical protein